MIRIFAALRALGMEAFSQLRWTLITILGATALGIVAILLFAPSVGVCVWITLAPWLFTAYRLFSIRRFIRMHFTGEALELLQLAGGVKLTTSVFDNAFIRTYLSIISGVFLVQTALFLMLPLYVNYTDGGITTAIIITMLMVVVAISSATFFTKMLRTAIVVTVVAYSVGLVFALFPQVSFYLGGITGVDKVQTISVSTAKRVSKLNELRKEQQEQIDNEFVDGVIAWQKANPGKPLPPEYQAAFDRALYPKVMKGNS